MLLNVVVFDLAFPAHFICKILTGQDIVVSVLVHVGGLCCHVAGILFLCARHVQLVKLLRQLAAAVAAVIQQLLHVLHVEMSRHGATAQVPIRRSDRSATPAMLRVRFF